MTTDQLLRELEPLTHSQRVQRMIELGRLDATGSGRDTARSIRGGSAEIPRIAGFVPATPGLYTCLGSRDYIPVAMALTDISGCAWAGDEVRSHTL